MVMAEAMLCEKSYLDYFKYSWNQAKFSLFDALNILDFIEILLSVSGETWSSSFLRQMNR